ncbi:MAG: agmatine deiminase, partial [Bacilli bacterium]
MNSIEKELENINGYAFPFEGEKHLATIVELPYRKDTWRENGTPALREFLAVVRAISQYEMVVVIADPRIDFSIVRDFQMPNTHILRLPYDDSWARDNIGVFLLNNETKLLCGVDFLFNAWGGKIDGLYKDWNNDNNLSKNTFLDLLIPRYPQKDFILEGGSIHTDGKGTILTTEECLLSKGRNSSLTKEEISQKLMSSLNARKILWLPYGIYNDETNGHVDNIACFLKPGTVALAWCDEETNPEQFGRCLADLQYLESQSDADGNPLTIVKVTLPKPLYLTDEEAKTIENDDTAIERVGGRRLAASYINFYQGERFVLVPQFNDEQDLNALDFFKEQYPNKDIIPIPSREILLGGGNIHCI